MKPRRSQLETWISAKQGAVTLVFTDVVRSTALLYGTGSIIYMRAIRSHRRHAKQLVESLQGHVIDTSGDAVFSAFHSAAAAFRFALSIIENPGDEQVHVRVGIHHGVVHANGDGLFGKAVHFAARLSERGGDSEIWASDAAKQELEAESTEFASQIDWRRCDQCALEGIPGVHTIWLARAADEAARHQ
jgi:class 3 adenylate cyclase